MQVSRTFYAKGQTGQQLLLGAYSAMNRQIARGKIKMYSRHEMMDIVIVKGKARGIIARNLVNGEIERHSAHAVVIASGGYGNIFFLSTNAMGSNVSAAWKIHKKGAFFANPCFTQIHPTCIPVSGDYQSKLTLMSESLRNDGRIWVPKEKADAKLIREGKLSPVDIPEDKVEFGETYTDPVSKLRVSTPPRLELAIVNVSPIRYPDPAAFNASPVITPSALTVVSTVNPDPVPPVVATPVPLENPPTPPDAIDPSVTTDPGVGSPDKLSVNVVAVARLFNIALSCAYALSSFA